MFSYPQVVDNFVNKRNNQRKRYEMMNIKPHGPLPSQAQLAYLESGQEDPKRFNPTKLDAREWVRVLKETGFKKLILVVKHHDGFVLYPTAYTDYSVKASPWRGGKGDLLLEVSKAATEFDMDLGVYLSPWDAHSSLYHVDREADYNAYYLAQLKEILSNPEYGNAGKFAEVWMDGARGEGAQKVNYEFKAWFETIRDLQGDCLIFSTEGTSIRWIGNERGYAGDPLWQKVKSDQLGTEAALDYLQHGDPSGTLFSIGEADVSLRSGWFYHEDQDPKSLEELVERIVDGNAVYRFAANDLFRLVGVDIPGKIALRRRRFLWVEGISPAMLGKRIAAKRSRLLFVVSRWFGFQGRDSGNGFRFFF